MLSAKQSFVTSSILAPIATREVARIVMVWLLVCIVTWTMRRHVKNVTYIRIFVRKIVICASGAAMDLESAFIARISFA